MNKPQTNFRVLKKTRRKPEAGDIFAYQLEPLPDRYFFGRVVATDTKIGNMPDGVVLIYLYRTSSSAKSVIPPLRLTDLLIPPVGTNAQPWLRGFFELVGSGKNALDDVLPKHCFRDYRGWYFDEYGHRLSEPVEPIGEYGLSGIGGIDLDVSKALGLPLKVV